VAQASFPTVPPLPGSKPDQSAADQAALSRTPSPKPGVKPKTAATQRGPADLKLTADTPNGTFAPNSVQRTERVYQCELNRKVFIRDLATVPQTISVSWNGQQQVLAEVRSDSGAQRYEDPRSGLAWILVEDKAMLLNSKTGRQLANECRT
jgi:membrane-bound inhibitor of C-type lysozyme